MSAGTGIWEGHETFKVPNFCMPSLMRMGKGIALYSFLFYMADVLGKMEFTLSNEEVTKGTGLKHPSTYQQRLANEKLIQFKAGKGECWYGLLDSEGQILAEDWWK